ncbi:hypothetical protein BJF78_19465 [Pseudonocardia sp. CNS-139]|nr:hypothetical protein BJF78_19465 [Pseudonocardia sp. CNS-139]
MTTISGQVPAAAGLAVPASGAGGVSLRGVSCRFGPETAVAGLDLDVAPGEFVSILGPSGSGKTTTLMMVAGFVEPTGGSILVAGRPVGGVPPERRNLGMVFQSYALFPHMTVEQNVAFPLEVRHIGSDVIREKVGRTLEIVGLGGLRSRLPAELSGGQQQRVALARALVFDPPVLLMDEPLAALDRKLRGELQLEIRRIQQELAVTVLYVTHDQEEAMTVSDRIAVMNAGELEQFDVAETLYRLPASLFVAEFLGASNILRGSAGVSQGGVVEVSLGEGATVRGTAAGTASAQVPAGARP